ncbi:MAG: acyl-CoA desaturase [Acidimicrobiia bacterium]
MQHEYQRAPDERINWRSSTFFFLAQCVPLLAVFTGITLKAVLLGVVLYFGRMFAITAGYHRYFAHRAYKMSRVPQFLMAFAGGTSAQKGALWWASYHRHHHRYSDTELDIHSPKKGFWWSHMGWIVCDKYNETHYDQIKDFAKYPELVWLNKHDWVPPWTLGIVSFLVAGWPGLVVGFFGSTVLLWHGTFSVNSLTHVFGRRRFDTTDTSRNSWLIALWTGGEGWHNNHHHFQASARNGFYWWEYDPTYYVLRIMSWLHITRDLKPVPVRVLDEGRVARRVRAAMPPKPDRLPKDALERARK